MQRKGDVSANGGLTGDPPCSMQNLPDCCWKRRRSGPFGLEAALALRVRFPAVRKTLRRAEWHARGFHPAGSDLPSVARWEDCPLSDWGRGGPGYRELGSELRASRGQMVDDGRVWDRSVGASDAARRACRRAEACCPSAPVFFSRAVCGEGRFAPRDPRARLPDRSPMGGGATRARKRPDFGHQTEFWHGSAPSGARPKIATWPFAGDALRKGSRTPLFRARTRFRGQNRAVSSSAPVQRRWAIAVHGALAGRFAETAVQGGQGDCCGKGARMPNRCGRETLCSQMRPSCAAAWGASEFRIRGRFVQDAWGRDALPVLFGGGRVTIALDQGFPVATSHFLRRIALDPEAVGCTPALAFLLLCVGCLLAFAAVFLAGGFRGSTSHSSSSPWLVLALAPAFPHMRSAMCQEPNPPRARHRPRPAPRHPPYAARIRAPHRALPPHPTSRVLPHYALPPRPSLAGPRRFPCVRLPQMRWGML